MTGGPWITNCDFFDCGGLAENSSPEPKLTINGNVVWPRGWTEEMSKQWRLDNSALIQRSFKQP